MSRNYFTGSGLRLNHAIKVLQPFSSADTHNSLMAFAGVGGVDLES